MQLLGGKPQTQTHQIEDQNFKVSWYDLSYSIEEPDTEGITSAFRGIEYFLREAFRDSHLARLYYSALKRSSGSYSFHDNQFKQQQQQQQQHEQTTIKILSQVSGSFRSGQLTGILGPSGAGKTSLLNIVSRRREQGFSGRLVVDSESKQQVNTIAIPQHNHLPEYLTVGENLMFASRLKNRTDGVNHEKEVQRVIDALDLNDCTETSAKLISGGQQKRTEIAQELLSRPDVLILDEPTSGLDSSTCIKTLNVLKDLVRHASFGDMKSPIAIVLTIHQPQQEAFYLFDKVYVMASGGLAIYDGPPSRCTEFVKKHTGIDLPAKDYNPASFMIDIASGEYGPEPIEKLERQVRSEKECINNQYYKKLEVQKMGLTSDVMARNHGSQIALTPSDGGNCSDCNHVDTRIVRGFKAPRTVGSFCHELSILTERRFYAMLREPFLIIFRLLFFISIPATLAMMFGSGPGELNYCPHYQRNYSLAGIVKDNSYVSEEVIEEVVTAFETVSMVFLTINSIMACAIGMATISFALDLRCSLREYHNGWYSLNSYLFSHVLANIPLDVILPLASIASLYIFTGQDPGNETQFPYILRVILTASGLVIATITMGMIGPVLGVIYMDHITTAIFASQVVTIPSFLLSGFCTRVKNMPIAIQYLAEAISIIKHPMDISFLSRYSWGVCPCDPQDFVQPSPMMIGIPDRLNNFVDFWRTSSQDSSTDTTSEGHEQENIFDVIAKQLSIFNSFGIELESCQDMHPHILVDFGLLNTSIPNSFSKLMCMLLAATFLMSYTIHIIIKNRTSL